MIFLKQLFMFELLNLSFLLVPANIGDDIFRQDIGSQMEIGLANTGYKSVELRCGSESMVVNIERDDEFLGVIYTRGSFYDKKSPCFYDTNNKSGQMSFTMKIPFDKCNTVQEGNTYTNVLILQHDKELIMPGDAAFSLECDFNKPRDITVTADMHSTNKMGSRITLVDADPSNQVKKADKTVESYTNSVIITPEALNRRPREEL